jgi:hypothetical protein
VSGAPDFLLWEAFVERQSAKSGNTQAMRR